MKRIFIVLMFIPLSIFSNEKMDYWKSQKKGANGSFTIFREDWFKAARDSNLDYIRLATHELASEEKHFLIGSANDVEDFKKLNWADVEYLRKILDTAHKYNIKIVLTMFELPGRVYFSKDKKHKDSRLWEDKKFWNKSFELWKQLATEFKDHPAVAAYNPLNEPDPAIVAGYEEPSRKFKTWLKETNNSASDLNLFNRKMIEAIREVDSYTPIMIDGYFYADPQGLPFTEKFSDDYVLYAFHNPAPWLLVTYRANKGRYSYPDRIPMFWNGPSKKWSIKDLKKTLDPVHKFIITNKIEPYKVVASEVWYDRRVEGCADYFRDILSLYNSENWHWSFYAFRNDTAWSGLDYELGSEPIEGSYWVKVENGVDPESLKVRKMNPIWREIQKALAD